MSFSHVADLFISLREDAQAGELILDRAGLCGRLDALGAAVLPVGLAELSLRCPPALVPVIHRELAAWTRDGRNRRVLIRSGESVTTIPAESEPDPMTVPLAEIVETDAGPLRRYPLTDRSFVLVDDTGHDLAVSWSGTCTPTDFLRICRPLVVAERGATIMVAVDGEPVTGPAAATVAQVSRRHGPDLDRACDFIRLDAATLCLAFHRMPVDDTGESLIVVSAVGERRFAESFSLIADFTTTPEVTRLVAVLIRDEVARNPLPAVLVNLQHPTRSFPPIEVARPSRVAVIQPEVPIVDR